MTNIKLYIKKTIYQRLSKTTLIIEKLTINEKKKPIHNYEYMLGIIMNILSCLYSSWMEYINKSKLKSIIMNVLSCLYT
jgi:hypothetical protein